MNGIKKLDKQVAALLLVAAILLLMGGAYAQSTPLLPSEPILTSNIPPTKLAFLNMIDATEVAALTAVPTAPRDPKYRPRPTSLPKRTFVTRIVEGYAPPLPSEVYQINNQWDGQVGSTIYQVYAGLDKIKAPPQGVLLVTAYQSDTYAAVAGGEYLPPAPTGPLKLVSFQGTQLTVVDTVSKKQLTFDVSTRQWVAP